MKLYRTNINLFYIINYSFCDACITILQVHWNHPKPQIKNSIFVGVSSHAFFIANMQWYQTSLDVTVCLETNGIDARNISANFDRKKCIIKAADSKLYKIILVQYCRFLKCFLKCVLVFIFIIIMLCNVQQVHLFGLVTCSIQCNLKSVRLNLPVKDSKWDWESSRLDRPGQVWDNCYRRISYVKIRKKTPCIYQTQQTILKREIFPVQQILTRWWTGKRLEI